jgi:hypothetical protein
MYPLTAAAAAAVALFALWNFLRRVRRDRLLADTSAVRLRSAAQGYVKVSGRALPAGAEPAQAPLSGRPCVWWSYDIARDDSQENQVSDWHTVESAASVEMLVLAGEDGALPGRPGARRDHPHHPQRLVRLHAASVGCATAAHAADALWRVPL